MRSPRRPANWRSNSLIDCARWIGRSGRCRWHVATECRETLALKDRFSALQGPGTTQSLETRKTAALDTPGWASSVEAVASGVRTAR